MVGGDRQRDPAGTAADDKVIGKDPSRGQGGHRACPHSRAYGSSGGAVAAGLHRG